MFNFVPTFIILINQTDLSCCPLSLTERRKSVLRFIKSLYWPEWRDLLHIKHLHLLYLINWRPTVKTSSGFKSTFGLLWSIKIPTLCFCWQYMRWERHDIILVILFTGPTTNFGLAHELYIFVQLTTCQIHQFEKNE